MRRLLLACVTVVWLAWPAAGQEWPIQNFGSWSGIDPLWGTSTGYSDPSSESFGGQIRANLSLGGGTIKTQHDVSQGAAGTLVYVDFEFFTHTKTTELKDGYVSLGGSLNYGSFEFLTLDLGTNFSLKTRFNQYTDPVFGYIPPGSATVYGRYGLGVLWLGDTHDGDITLDSWNRFWKAELMGHVPIWGAWNILVGYKFNSVKSDIQPASQTYGPGEWGGFRGYQIQGWENGWTDLATSSVTSFAMSQLVLWHGLYAGVGWRDFLEGISTTYYFSLTATPWLFGRYEFDWRAEYTQNGSYIAGSQLTRLDGWQKFGVDFRGGFDLHLSQKLLAGLNGAYSYARMSGSQPEAQQLSNNIDPADPYWASGNYSQSTDGSVTLTQNFWTVGGSVGLIF